MSAYTASEYHPAFEEYCEAIFELKEDGLKVIQARIAERLEVSRPAVSEMVKKLTQSGFVSVTKGEISLTETGKALGSKVVRRHRLAERFLTDVLGLSWSVAHHEAGKWEHVISDVVEVAMVKLLEEPTTCPHGNPIPGSDYKEPDTTPLSAVNAGASVLVSRIPEELEFVPGMLEFLEKHQILPGTTVTVELLDPNGGMTLSSKGKTATIDAFTAARILVASEAPSNN